jgi:hypothetical protein
MLDTFPVDMPVSLAMSSRDLPLRYACITSELIERLRTTNLFIHLLYISKNFINKKGPSFHRYFRHFFRHFVKKPVIFFKFHLKHNRAQKLSPFLFKNLHARI